MSKKPNIVYVFADQLRYQSCGYAGDRVAHTPNIDRLASEGVNFKNAVSGMPVCCAYRASLFIGKYVTSTGMIINELRMNPNHKCFAHVLNDGGYDLGYIGKWHLWANEYGGHDKDVNAYTPPGEYRLGFDGYWAAYNFRHLYYNGIYYENTPERIKVEGYEPDVQTDMAIDFINSKAGKNEPFALFLSYGPPHDPWKRSNVPDEYYKMFENVKFDKPVNYSDEMDKYGDEWSNVEKTWDTVQEKMRIYYAMTSNLDWNLGRLMHAIRTAGIEEDTIFVFTSDHGEMFGGHGRMKKNSFYEESLRVPFLMKWGSKSVSGVRDTCLNSADIMPTILSLAGLNVPDDVEGMDLSHVVLGQEGPEPDAALIQNTGACAIWEDGHEWRGLRDKQYTYAVYKVDGYELLFDNENDPYQMNNLAENSQYKDLLNKFRKKLKDKMDSIDDVFESSTWYKKLIKDRLIPDNFRMKVKALKGDVK